MILSILVLAVCSLMNRDYCFQDRTECIEQLFLFRLLSG